MILQVILTIVLACQLVLLVIFTYYFVNLMRSLISVLRCMVKAVENLRINIINDKPQQKIGGISNKVEKTKVEELPPEIVAPYIGRVTPSGFNFKTNTKDTTDTDDKTRN